MTKAADRGARMCVSGVAIPHERVQVSFEGEESKTRQEFAAESDINTIMARYEKTGVWPMVDAPSPRYLDCSEIPDFQSALHIVMEAETAFMSLPANVRKEFDNNTAKFADFASDPANLGQMREWGLAPPEKAPEPPMKVEVVSPSSPPPAAPAGS